VKDGLITLVMPGGLLYAASRTHEHQQAADRLAAVDKEMDGIGEDIEQLSIPVDETTFVALPDGLLLPLAAVALVKASRRRSARGRVRPLSCLARVVVYVNLRKLNGVASAAMR